ncbi:hypothetical protein K469DRAFT_687048 [Zopfia rhizophila CBS 207.26]|uniref:Uncharacterized protein n=1 Tax=Zopfia rhizophila CBS 207.26 TaxID=1314779 RepID=A0A6A6E939_9PEZI|nr:hypothetical protein K469DRAFT_687048 [Zopfia rhizophila CBS 207.26]
MGQSHVTPGRDHDRARKTLAAHVTRFNVLECAFSSMVVSSRPSKMAMSLAVSTLSCKNLVDISACARAADKIKNYALLYQKMTARSFPRELVEPGSPSHSLGYTALTAHGNRRQTAPTNRDCMVKVVQLNTLLISQPLLHRSTRRLCRTWLAREAGQVGGTE